MRAELLDNFSEFTAISAANELESIARWWLEHSLDFDNGGFWGEIDNDAKPSRKADKGIVLNTRVLWFFSELAFSTENESYKSAAHRAYEYLLSHFFDTAFGGFFWSLDYKGHVIDAKKQVYAQCFAVYALCSYSKLTGNEQAKALAYSTFELIEHYALDREQGGYIEACSREWGSIDDYRLSDKDLNCPKSMNTHLHVLEAYTSLHHVSPNENTANALRHALTVFLDKIVTDDGAHLKLFFDTQWTCLSHEVSYGHDIEASWLIYEAAEVLEDEQLTRETTKIALTLASVCRENGIAANGYVLDEYNPQTREVSDNSYWWVQAEALVGFYNAYQLTKDRKYLEAVDHIWQFIQSEHKDHGEWLWLARSQGGRGLNYKAGSWKGPYHNGRAMLEMVKRFKEATANE
ncbi:AGE family epimerase/isomerase [Alteromonas stellipolaris]|uniref:AGE family epimerase/isomerase n=1 Tax=Alteromonas stellipolaris TaxID=233316 RepID=UPI0026E3CD4D|nr:AGE family epimerase/isomerase [Alteromonas stellipolaris]MDO6539234.1 AGE family epimerase/isomerase [Alteromonas stellipolaris]